ncbi:YraN family protein [Zeaxanthinibacter enoshimensis]|uniref:YraN family protein n=1 Tax=Zeaxanthinibacter enoshimensis TaxID=392009 RepID=UPI00356A7C13
MRQQNREIGKRAEARAVTYLEEKGYTILETNYYYNRAEIDIIARKAGVLAVVEVKFRSSDYFSETAATVTPKKIKLMVMAADHYIQQNKLDLETRFDIITYLEKSGKTEMQHLEDAFYHF